MDNALYTENTIPNVKHGGEAGTGKLIRVEGKTDDTKYRREENLFQAARDNNLKHTAKINPGARSLARQILSPRRACKKYQDPLCPILYL